MSEKVFEIDVDRSERVVTIQGIRYSFDLFDELGFGPEGKILRLGKRADGVVTLHGLEAIEFGGGSRLVFARDGAMSVEFKNDGSAA